MEPNLFEVAEAFSIPKLDTKKYQTMFHYTSPEGLLGILEKGAITLWFSRYDCLNDASEGLDIQDQFIVACEELLTQNTIDSDFFELIKSLKPSDVDVFGFPNIQKDSSEPFAFMTSMPYEAFICCFSAKQDSLPMWNYYIKGNQYQGYNIGLNSTMFEDNKRNRNVGFFEQNGFMKIYVGKVLYDAEEKQKILQSRIQKLSDYYKSTQNINNLIKNLVTMLTQLRMLFKNPAFKHEEEIRAILHRPTSIPNDVTRNYELPVLRYRSQSGMVVPYISVQFYRYHNYLDNITVGPMANQDSAVASISLMLKEKNYRAEVLKSTVPVRY